MSALVGCSHAPPKNEPEVTDLVIEGAHQVDPGDIKDKLLTSETSWVPFASKQYFDPDIWKTDLRRIERYYRAQGYYQAKVTQNRIEPHDGDQVSLHVVVNEGQPTQVGKVELTGIDDLTPSQQHALRDQVGLKPGQVFREADFEGLKQKLLDTLEELGFATARVQGAARVGLDTHRANISLKVDHGPRYHFGSISVKEQENARVPAWRIAEQAEAAMPQDDWYSLSAQQAAQQRVFGMGVFGAAKVRPQQANPATRTVPMQVQTQESPFHTVRVGGGVGVDQTRQEAHVYGQYIDRDFKGGLRQLTLGGSVGWAWIPSLWTNDSSGAVGNLSAELQQPRFYFRDLKADVRVEGERGLEPAYRYWGAKAKLGLIWQPTAYLSITPSYNVEFYRLQSGVASLGGSAPSLLFNCPENCLLSYVEQRIEWDHRDDAQEPRHGYYLALSLQEGGGPLGGSFDYLRIEPEARAYLSMLADDKLTFAFRVRLGTLLTGGDTKSPIVARFFSGGNQMRGFGARYLSPLALVASDATATEGYYVPLGGNGLAEGSVEARYRIGGGPLELAAFMDTGAVTAGRLRFSGTDGVFDNLQFAFGGGLRYLTPIGPIRLDFAYRPDIGPALPVERLANVAAPAASGCFGLGGARANGAGAPEGPCSIQISIGEAF